MNLSHHILQSYTDNTWIQEYILKMGEENFYQYKDKVYNRLYQLEVGQSISIVKWVEPQNYDLFIKIACCFMSETHGCYYFYDNHTIIKHTFDHEQMEKTLAIFKRKPREDAAGKDSQTTGSDTIRTSSISAPQADVQNKREEEPVCEANQVQVCT